MHNPFQTSPFSLQTSKVVAPRIELSATRVSGGFGRPALDYHVVVSKKSDTSESNRLSRSDPQMKHCLLLPNQACFHLHLYPICVAASVGAYLPCQWAGRRSNPRLRFFRPPLDRLSYQPMLACWVRPVRTRKKARCLRDTEPSCRKQFA